MASRRFKNKLRNPIASHRVNKFTKAIGKKPAFFCCVTFLFSVGVIVSTSLFCSVHVRRGCSWQHRCILGHDKGLLLCLSCQWLFWSLGKTWVEGLFWIPFLQHTNPWYTHIKLRRKSLYVWVLFFRRTTIIWLIGPRTAYFQSIGALHTEQIYRLSTKTSHRKIVCIVCRSRMTN